MHKRRARKIVGFLIMNEKVKNQMLAGGGELRLLNTRILPKVNPRSSQYLALKVVPDVIL